MGVFICTYEIMTSVIFKWVWRCFIPSYYSVLYFVHYSVFSTEHSIQKLHLHPSSGGCGCSSAWSLWSNCSSIILLEKGKDS